MSLSRYVMMAILPCALNAAAAPQASDPQAPVPAPAYVSALAGYHAAPEQKETPDALWRQVNQEVAGAASHAGHMGDMSHMNHAGHVAQMAAPAADPAPARQKTQRKTEQNTDVAPPANPHHGHDMSKHHQGD